jgi:hypothetical protein
LGSKNNVYLLFFPRKREKKLMRKMGSREVKISVLNLDEVTQSQSMI